MQKTAKFTYFSSKIYLVILLIRYSNLFAFSSVAGKGITLLSKKRRPPRRDSLHLTLSSADYFLELTRLIDINRRCP